MRPLDEGVAVGALSLAVVQIFEIYQRTAPTLAEIRRAPPGDYVMRQLVLDADMLGLIIVMAIGGGGSILTKRVYPVILAGAALAMISLYYRMVLNSSNEGMVS